MQLISVCSLFCLYHSTDEIYVYIYIYVYTYICIHIIYTASKWCSPIQLSLIWCIHLRPHWGEESSNMWNLQEKYVVTQERRWIILQYDPFMITSTVRVELYLSFRIKRRRWPTSKFSKNNNSNNKRDQNREATTGLSTNTGTDNR